MHIRTMQPADHDFAAACTLREGWLGETRDQFGDFFARDPAGCFLAEEAARPVGIVVATGYGRWGFVGELIVVPEMRGRGIGRQLLDHAVAYLLDRGARAVYLDGVPAAVPLYERAGFRKVCRSLRFRGRLYLPAPYPGVRPMRPADLDACCALDREAFGGDRRFFLERRLERFPELCHVLEFDGRVEGLIMGRRGENWTAVGPWILAPDAASRAVGLLAALAANAPSHRAVPPGSADEISVGVLDAPQNRAAVELARSLGLVERADSPWRMVLGENSEPFQGRPEMVYGVGSAAKG